MTTGAPAQVHADVRLLTWIAIALSVCTSVFAWFGIVGANTALYQALPGWIFACLIYLLPVNLILITWAGSRGHTNHILSIVALVILFSPVLPFVL